MIISYILLDSYDGY